MACGARAAGGRVAGDLIDARACCSVRRVPAGTRGRVPSLFGRRNVTAFRKGTMPPLLVEGGQLKDGHHRLRAMRARNVMPCWVYDVDEILVPSLYTDPDRSSKAM